MQKSLYDSEIFTECLTRLETIESGTTPVWGKMTAAQMFAHCTEVLDVMMGKPLQRTPFIARLFARVIRKGVFGPQPYRRSTRTHPQYQMTGPLDFIPSKHALILALQRFREMSVEESNNLIHPLFGQTSREEKGWGMYKHLDHHLRQFGA